MANMNADKAPYWASVEFEYANDHPRSGELEGGFVYVFLPAEDARDALEKLDHAFRAHKLVPGRVEFIMPYLDIEWQSDEEKARYDALAEEAGASGDILFDDLYASAERDDE